MANRNDRTITLAGDFNQSVEITNSLMNGEACSASDYGHAEGHMSNSEGKYSYAGGYSAYAKHNNSFVWSGRSNGSNFMSAADGTFNIYTDSGTSDPLNKVYLDGETLYSRINNSFSEDYLNTNLLTSTNVWDKKNTFTGGVNGGVILDGVTLTGTSNSTISMANGSTASFSGTLKSKTIAFKLNNETGVNGLDTVATTQYVKNLFSSSLADVSNDYVKRGGASSSIGSSIKPVYINSNGIATPIQSEVVLRHSSSLNIGTMAKPIYMENGYLKQTSNTIGGGAQPIFMSDGTLFAINGNVCTDGKSLMYMSNGKFVKSDKSEGNNLRPVYLENGVLKPIGNTGSGNNYALGGRTRPIYINSEGKFTVCDPYPSGGGGSTGIVSVTVDNENVVSNNFLSAIKSVQDSATGTVQLQLTRSRPTMGNIQNLIDDVSDGKGGMIKGKLTWTSGNCSSLMASCKTNYDGISSIHANLPTVYCKKFVKVEEDKNTSGNTIVGINFYNQTGTVGPSLIYSKGDRLEGVDATTGTGNFIKSISQSQNKVKSVRGYAVNNVQGDGTTGTFVSSLSYDNAGNVTVSYGTPSAGTSSRASFQGTLLGFAGTQTKRATIASDGIVSLVINPLDWNDSHVLNVYFYDNKKNLLDSVENLKAKGSNPLTITRYAKRGSLYVDTEFSNKGYECEGQLISIVNS